MNEYSQGQILLPLLALVGWTFIVLIQIPYRRFRAVKQGDLTPDDFSLGESSKVSNYVALANRNYMNLLELPVLFYLACLLYYILDSVSLYVLILAWVYVFLRVAHSLVHISYNRVTHRLACFALSNFALMAIWVLLVGSIINSPT